MSYKFVNQPLEGGRYEPEGVYLVAPFAGVARLVQPWGAHPQFHGQFQYNGTKLKGHPGVDFALAPGTSLRAVDSGRVMEISIEQGGFERYIKLEHRWGESFYAHIGAVAVESGQLVKRGEVLAESNGSVVAGEVTAPHLHFAIRIAPYNRFDGWGGFANPLPFMDPAAIAADQEHYGDELASFAPPPMLQERSGMRRP